MIDMMACACLLDRSYSSSTRRASASSESSLSGSWMKQQMIWLLRSIAAGMFFEPEDEKSFYSRMRVADEMYAVIQAVVKAVLR